MLLLLFINTTRTTSARGDPREGRRGEGEAGPPSSQCKQHTGEPRYRYGRVNRTHFGAVATGMEYPFPELSPNLGLRVLLGKG